MSEAANQENNNPDAPNAAGNAAAEGNVSAANLLIENDQDEKQGLIGRMCCTSSARRAKLDDNGVSLPPSDANKPE